MIRIREAALDDVPAIARVHVQADWDTYSALLGSQARALDLGESEDRWRRALRDGDILLVASDGDAIVGLGHAGGDRIGALYLLRSYQRRGIGRALLTRLLAALNERGIGVDDDVNGRLTHARFIASCAQSFAQAAGLFAELFNKRLTVQERHELVEMVEEIARIDGLFAIQSAEIEVLKRRVGLAPVG
jgi:GNAT superfamily N-acetyltransferase